MKIAILKNSVTFSFILSALVISPALHSAAISPALIDQILKGQEQILKQQQRSKSSGSWTGAFFNLAVGVALVGYGLGKLEKYLLADQLVKKQERAEKLGEMNIEQGQEIRNEEKRRRFHEAQILAQNPHMSEEEFMKAVAAKVPEAQQRELPEKVTNDYEYFTKSLRVINGSLDYGLKQGYNAIKAAADMIWLTSGKQAQTQRTKVKAQAVHA